MTIEQWISRLDNEEADKLTQSEQLEIKSLLVELRERRIKELQEKRRTLDARAAFWRG